MDRARAIDIATERVLRQQLKRVAEGHIPGAATAFDQRDQGEAGVASNDELAETYLAKEAKRNQAEIVRIADALMNGTPAIACCRCAAPSTATINGDPYCDGHAATAKRLPRPEKLQA